MNFEIDDHLHDTYWTMEFHAQETYTIKQSAGGDIIDTESIIERFEILKTNSFDIKKSKKGFECRNTLI